MCLFKIFKKKSNGEKNKIDFDLVQANYKYVETLKVLAQGGDAAVEEKLTEIQNKLQFLMPSDNDKVKDYDKKIKNALEDVKIALVKDKADAKILSLIKEVEVAVAERNAIL